MDETMWGKPSVFGDAQPQNNFVAFVDFLGFSARVNTSFNSAVELVDAIATGPGLTPESYPNSKFQLISDAFVASSVHLAQLVQLVRDIQFVVLFHDCLVRGGLAFGRHLSATSEGNQYYISEGLVRAVEIEKTVSVPCVAIHPDINVPNEWRQPTLNNFHRPILRFENVLLVNPFNPAWGVSAQNRVWQMRQASPQYAVKFDWFLALYEAVRDGQDLTP